MGPVPTAYVSCVGDLIRIYREQSQPHTCGVVLQGDSSDCRKYQREALVKLHPDNAVLSDKNFFVYSKTGWACGSKETPSIGISVQHWVQFQNRPDDKVLLRLLADAPAGKSSAVVINDILTSAQTQFCLRLYLDRGADTIRLIKGYEVDDEILALLHLEKKEKPASGAPAMMDRIGLYDRYGFEIDLLECTREGHVQFYAGFERNGKGMDQVRAYSEGTPLDFFQDCSRIMAKELFGTP